MSPKNSSEESSIWKSFVDGIQERFGDVFISYFITFEILFNWKFFYTLFVKDPDKSEKIITTALKYFEQNPNLTKLNSFSSLWLSTLAALLMCLAYPFMSHVIKYFRKQITYWSNNILLKDYPTREEYNELIVKSNKVSGELENTKTNYQSEIDRIVQVLLNDELIIEKKKINYCVMRSSTSFEFLKDQIVRKTLNGNMIERLDGKNTNKDNLFMVVEKISHRIYLVASIAQIIPVTKAMRDSGQSIVVFDKSGYPHFVNEDAHREMRRGDNFFFMGVIKQETISHLAWD